MGNKAGSLLTNFIEVAERQRLVSPAGALYVPLPHESDTGSEADMETTGAETPTQDEYLGETGKAPPSPEAVITTDNVGRRLVLAATSPTYTPPPVGSLHRGLRMVVADLSNTFSPPPDPACGDQWRGPDYVPTPIAELERLEVRRLQLQEEIRSRRAGYSINWAQCPSPPPLMEEGAAAIRCEQLQRPRPSAFSPPRQGRTHTAEENRREAPPAYAGPSPPAYTARALTPRGQPTATRIATPTTARARPEEVRVVATDQENDSYLEQFIPAERAPMDPECGKVADNTAKLLTALWNNPMTKAEAAELYATLPRPENAETLHKTRMNPEIEHTLQQRVKDNDLGAAQWGVQFAARPIVKALDAVERGQPLEKKELVAALVDTLKILARTSNTLLGLRRDNVRPSLQLQIKTLAKKEGSKGFKYLLGEDLTAQVTALEATQKTASSIVRGQSNRPRHGDRKSGNFRGGHGRGRPTQYPTRQRQEEPRHYQFHPRQSGGSQTRPQRGGRGRGSNHNSSYRRPARQ